MTTEASVVVESVCLGGTPEATFSTLDAIHLDLLCLPVFEGQRPPLGLASWVDWRTSGWLSRLLASERFVPTPGTRLLTPVQRTGWAKGAVLIGQGHRGGWNVQRARAFVSAAVAVARDLQVHRVGLELPGETELLSDGEVAALVDAPAPIQDGANEPETGWSAHLRVFRLASP